MAEEKFRIPIKINRIKYFSYYALAVMGLAAAYSLSIVMYGVVGFVGIILIIELVRWSQSDHVLTERGILEEEGIISKRERYLPYNDIKETLFKQTVMQRLFGAADLDINTGASSEIEVSLKNISKPHLIKSIIDQRKR